MACTRTASSFASPSPTCAAEGMGAGAVSADSGALPAAAARAKILATSSPPDILYLYHTFLNTANMSQGWGGIGASDKLRSVLCGDVTDRLTIHVMLPTVERWYKGQAPNHRHIQLALGVQTTLSMPGEEPIRLLDRDCTAGLLL